MNCGNCILSSYLSTRSIKGFHQEERNFVLISSENVQTTGSTEEMDEPDVLRRSVATSVERVVDSVKYSLK